MDTQVAIHGVSIKELTTHGDERGFFREIIRDSDSFFAGGFAQWSHSKMQRNTVKAWHFHHKQIDWWYVGLGAIHTVLYDNRHESPTYRARIDIIMGEQESHPEAVSCVVKIPQGVLHGCKVITEAAHLFYITSEEYDPQDEGRLPFNSPVVGQDWGKEEELIISAQDKREFIPPYELVRA